MHDNGGLRSSACPPNNPLFRAGLSLRGVNLLCVLYVKHDKICVLKITILHNMFMEFLILCVAFLGSVCVRQ